MKNLKKPASSLHIIFSIVLAVLFLVIFTTCSDPFSGQNEASLSIVLGNGNSRWGPHLQDSSYLDDMKFVVELSGPGTVKFEAEGGSIVTTTVTPGIWNVKIDAFKDNELYSIGISSVNVFAGRKNTATVTMKQPFEIEIEAIPGMNGYCTANHNFAIEGMRITITAFPEPGYFFHAWNIIADIASSESLQLSSPEANPATFIMPATNVRISASFGDELLRP